MIRPLELFIALRYTRARRRDHFISFISLISVLGIALGVAALITVLSVMNGFQREVRNGILGMASHATVQESKGDLEDWRSLAERLDLHSPVVGVAPYVKGQAMLTHQGNVTGALIRGILPDKEPQVSFIDEKMIVGKLKDLEPGAFDIILGRELARRLGVRVGSKVILIAPQINVTPVGMIPRLKSFKVVGTFHVGHHDYDSSLALLHLQDAAKLFRVNGEATGVRLKLKEMFTAPDVAKQLREELPTNLVVTDWTQRHANFFRAVAIEKRIMFIILTLIIAVAAFNIVSTLTMMVQDKRSDIAILRTLGITPNSTMAIFMIQGTAIGVLGTTLGMIGGITLALNIETVVPFLEDLLGVHFLSPGVYMIDEVPSELQWEDVAKIGLVALILSLVSTLYPAWRASHTQPAEALRHE